MNSQIEIEIESDIEDVAEETPTFLVLRNRSRLSGELPFAPSKKKVVPRERFFAVWNYIELFLVLEIVAAFVSTLSVNLLRVKRLFRISLSKVLLSLLSLVGTRLGCGIMVRGIVCILGRIFQSSDGFLYVVNKIQHNVQQNLMAWVILVVWELMYEELEKVLDSHVMIVIEKFLIASGIIFFVWAVKSALVMSLAAWFYMQTYHEKVSDSLFYQYVVEALSGLPLVEFSKSPIRSLRELQKFNPRFLSAWQRKRRLIENGKGIAMNIRTEAEAIKEAERIFGNVAQPLSSYIGLEDLKRFFPRDEALKTLFVFRRTYDNNEKIKISKVHSFKRDRCLLMSLKDTDDASKAIGTIFNIVFGSVLAAFSVPLLGLGGVKFLLIFSTNSLVFTYLFGQVWKEMFYAMQLLYIRHPFHVGDEVKIEETEMYVEKLKVMSTDFIGKDKKKYTIGNFTLCDKLVMNQSRSELPAWKIEDIV